MPIDLTTSYLGLPLKNPLIASASPLSRTVEGVRALEQAGVAAVVLHSLFAEQILMADYFYAEGYGSGVDSFQQALSYFPRWDQDKIGPEGYLDEIRLAKRTVSIPIIASLNGAAPGEWTQYAHLIEEAGADALELNLYYIPTEPHVTGEAVEQMHIDVVREVRSTIQIPLAVKIGSAFSSLPNMAQRLVEAGRGRADTVQPVLPAGAGHRKPPLWSVPWPQQFRQLASAATLDRAFVRHRVHRLCTDRRRSHP